MFVWITVLFIPVLFLIGKAALAFLYGNKKLSGLTWEDVFLTGGLLLIGLAEGAHLGALVHGQSVCAAQKYFMLLLGMAAALAMVFLVIKRLVQKSRDLSLQRMKEAGGKLWKAKDERLLLTALLGLIICQGILIIGRNAIFLDQDITLETVRTFLQEDMLYGCNPLTGRPYDLGMPSRLKILCLPTLYAVLCRLTGASPEFVVWHLIPPVVLIFAYLAYGSLGRVLFSENRKAQYRFLIIVGLLFFAGDAKYGMEGFGLLHVGFQGTTIRSAVLLPYLFSLCLRRRWRSAVLVILAEACLVWTFYGAGMSLIVMILFILIAFCKEKFFAGKEVSL